MYSPIRLFIPLLLLLLSLPLRAENVVDNGPYRVHYNAFKSEFLSPEVAKAYGLERSRYQAVVNITVQRAAGENRFDAMRAKVSGTSTNPYGQQHTLELKEVKEGEAIYYLAELGVRDGDTIDFAISITPEGSDKPISINFRQQFFVD